MHSIYVDTDALESAVGNFLYASKEAEEMAFRLKQLGNELADDPDLAISPEYESIMANYTEAFRSLGKINVFFETLLPAVLKTPEMYSDAEQKNLDRIRSLMQRSDTYESTVLNDTAAITAILRKTEEDDLTMEELTDFIDKSCQNLQAAAIGAQAIETEAAEPVPEDHTAEAVQSAYESTAAAAMASEIHSEDRKDED